MKNKYGVSLLFFIATFIILGDICEARICPPKANDEGVIVGIKNSQGGSAGSNVDRDADTRNSKNKPLKAQPSPLGVEKKPTKTEEQVALLKDLKDKTGGTVDLLKPKVDARKGKPGKGKAGKKPDEPPKPTETPPLPDDEVAGGDTGSGTRLSHADREQMKNKYGAEDVVGTKGDVFIQKDGKWMRPEEVKVSTDTAERQGDDPTEDPLFASAQNLLEAKQFDLSGQQQIDYGKKPDQFGSDQSKKLKDMQATLVKSKKEKPNGSSTEPSKKTKPGVKVPLKKEDKSDDKPEGKMTGKYEINCEIPESERGKYTGLTEIYAHGDFEMTVHSDRKVTGSLAGYFMTSSGPPNWFSNLTGNVDAAGNLHAVESRDGLIFKGAVIGTPKLSGNGDITHPKDMAPFVCNSWWKSH